MPQVADDRIRSLIALLFIVVIAGCSTPNNQSVLNPDTGKHAANWYVDHRAAFLANPSQCAECHGTDLHGGISQVSCFSMDFNGMSCHPNGPSGHPAGWASPDLHGASAKSAPNTAAMTGFSTCQSCHGNDFTGGTALQTCLNTAGCHGASVSAPHSPKPWRGGMRTHTSANPNNASVCAICHTNGANSSVQPSTPAPIGTGATCFNNTLCHADVGAPHPVPFTDPALHGPPAKTDLTYCEACHATPSNGTAGSDPRFNVPKGNIANGCETCHTQYMAHPSPWRGFTAGETGHMAAGNMANACALCHGVNLVGGVGPACTTCHKLGSPLTMTNCTSCHGNPPNSSVYPNAAGKHSQHGALGAYVICNACHNGGGTGTANHYNGNTSAFVAFLSGYNAKSGAASYNASTNTCSNVSCHGGQTTPGWLSGTVINVNTQCASCHISGTTQYNSYNSGHHTYHMNLGAVCIDCHDTTKLAAVHFNDLNTSQMTQGAQTLNSSLNYNGSYCNFTCHINNEQHGSDKTW